VQRFREHHTPGPFLGILGTTPPPSKRQQRKSTEQLMEYTLCVNGWETVRQFLVKLKVQVSYDPVIAMLGISKRIEIGHQTDICTPVFISASFTIVKG
jgi:hypothetical protein